MKEKCLIPYVSVWLLIGIPLSPSWSSSFGPLERIVPHQQVTLIFCVVHEQSLHLFALTKTQLNTKDVIFPTSLLNGVWVFLHFLHPLRPHVHGRSMSTTLLLPEFSFLLFPSELLWSVFYAVPCPVVLRHWSVSSVPSLFTLSAPQPLVPLLVLEQSHILIHPSPWLL